MHYNTELEDMQIDDEIDNRQLVNLTDVSLSRSLRATSPLFPYFVDTLNNSNCIERIALTDELDDENASIFSFGDLFEDIPVLDEVSHNISANTSLQPPVSSDDNPSHEALDEVSHDINANTSLLTPVSSDDNPSHEALNEESHDINTNTSLQSPVTAIKPITFVVINNSKEILSVINKVQFVQVNASSSQLVVNKCTSVRTSTSVEAKRKRGRPLKNRTPDEALQCRREVNSRAARNYRHKQHIYKSRSEKMLEAVEDLNVSLNSTVKRAEDLKKQLCRLLNVTQQQLDLFVK